MKGAIQQDRKFQITDLLQSPAMGKNAAPASPTPGIAKWGVQTPTLAGSNPHLHPLVPSPLPLLWRVGGSLKPHPFPTGVLSQRQEGVSSSVRQELGPSLYRITQTWGNVSISDYLSFIFIFIFCVWCQPGPCWASRVSPEGIGQICCQSSLKSLNIHKIHGQNFT